MTALVLVGVGCLMLGWAARGISARLLRSIGPVHIHLRLRRRRADTNICAVQQPGGGYAHTFRLHGQRMTEIFDRSPEQQRIDSDALAARGVLPGPHWGGNNAAPVCPSCGTLLPHLREIH